MGISERELAQLIGNVQRGKQPKKESRAPKASKSHNKFNAVKTGGCDSGKEYDRLQELRLMQKAGLIFDLIPHPTFLLVHAQVGPTGKKERSITFEPDAAYVEDGRLVVEDTKSPATKALPDYVMRRKLLLQVYGIEVREV